MPASAVRMGRHYLERDGVPFVPVGAHLVPVEGPDWPWRVGASSFAESFRAMASVGLDSVRIDLLWSAVEPASGQYDEAHLQVLDEILNAARANGVLLHPTLFIGGEVGDAFWDVPWRGGRHPHADPEMRALQVEQARMLARRWRADPTVLAWDLTDEPPFWLYPETSDGDARTWTDGLVRALREEDPEHLVTVGTAGQDIGWGPFRADVVSQSLDFACVHPYPIYEQHLYPDALLSSRMTHAAAFETALASGAGRPVMVHEYGASTAQFDPEAIARYDRLLTWSSFGRGAIGFFAWCWTDAEPAAYRRAPYVRQPHETQFGVTDHEGALRPRAGTGSGDVGRAGSARVRPALRRRRLRANRPIRYVRSRRAGLEPGPRHKPARPGVAQRLCSRGPGGPYDVVSPRAPG
jgi:endo-1,4-beta-mannosidase